MPRVTALCPERRERVAVELDGESWRVLPLDVVVRAGIREGRELDREALRLLRRELRRHEALADAAGALRHRDLTRGALDGRLQHAGAAPATRAEALDALERAGAVDDTRLAVARAAALAERGYGDAAIREDLARRLVPAEAAEAALAALEEESERARRVAAARGGSAKTARLLARRGFGSDAIEAALGIVVAEEP